MLDEWLSNKTLKAVPDVTPGYTSSVVLDTCLMSETVRLYFLSTS